MKKIIITSVVIALLFAVSSDVAFAQKPIKGQIVSLDDVIKKVPNLQLTKERAKELYENGSPLVFKVGSKIYFVQNEDGSFAFKKLSDFAHNKNVGIVGKTKTVNGINIIIMSKIDAM
jgi:hypothetical protein